MEEKETEENGPDREKDISKMIMILFHIHDNEDEEEPQPCLRELLRTSVRKNTQLIIPREQKGAWEGTGRGD